MPLGFRLHMQSLCHNQAYALGKYCAKRIRFLYDSDLSFPENTFDPPRFFLDFQSVSLLEHISKKLVLDPLL